MLCHSKCENKKDDYWKSISAMPSFLSCPTDTKWVISSAPEKEYKEQLQGLLICDRLLQGDFYKYSFHVMPISD